MSLRTADASLVCFCWTWRKKLSFHCTNPSYMKVMSTAPIREKSNATDRIDLIDIFSSLVLFALDPMSIEVSEKTIDIICTSGVSVPFTGIISQESFVHHGF